MRIGIDFDNTIICYDSVFRTVAVERGLVPLSIGEGKNTIRDYLRSEDRENDWTELQGIVYGSRIDLATPYEGALEFLKFCRETGISCYIISHKTRFPYAGKKVDLHKAASGWILRNKIPFDFYFEPEKELKVAKIVEKNCDIFIDDLPEFLNLKGFPEKTAKILFDPHGRHAGQHGHFEHVSSWSLIQEKVAAWNL